MQNKALLSQLGCSCQLGLKLGLAELGNIKRIGILVILGYLHFHCVMVIFKVFGNKLSQSYLIL